MAHVIFAQEMYFPLQSTQALSAYLKKAGHTTNLALGSLWINWLKHKSFNVTFHFFAKLIVKFFTPSILEPRQKCDIINSYTCAHYWWTFYCVQKKYYSVNKYYLRPFVRFRGLNKALPRQPVSVVRTYPIEVPVWSSSLKDSLSPVFM